MLYEKTKILIYRIVLGIVTLFSIFLPVIFIIPFSFFIASLFLSCREYYYDANHIVVYAGWFHHYIKINGEKFDEHNTIVTFTAIPLSCTLDDGTDINVVITLTNRIALKINNRLYTNYK